MRGEKKRYYISTIPKNPLKIKFKLKHRESASNKKRKNMYRSYLSKTSPLKMALKRASQKQMDGNNSAFNGSIDHRTFFIRGKQKDPLHLLKNYKERVYLLLKQKLRNTPIKFYITMLVRFYKYVEGERKTYSHFFHGCTQTLLHETNLDDTYAHSSRKIYENFDTHIKVGSGFMVDSIEKLNICTYKYSPIKASGFIPTPKWIADKKAIINV